MADQQIAQILRQVQETPEPHAPVGFWLVLLGLILGCLLQGPELQGLLLGGSLACFFLLFHRIFRLKAPAGPLSHRAVLRFR